MHLIVMTIAAQGCPPSPHAQDLKGLIERWSPLMPRLAPAWCLEEQADSLNTLGEQALARLVLGRPLGADDDGRLPLTAWSMGARRSGSPPVEAEQTASGFARLTPFHGLVGSDRITLVPPAELQLDADDSRALFQEIKPLFDSEGVKLSWHGPLEWMAVHASLRGLPCASLDRAQEDSVQRWQGCTPLAAARLIRRLQNEAQMVLHAHPVNIRRQERGQLTVNSLWLDRAGAVGERANEPKGKALRMALEAISVRGVLDADADLQRWVGEALKEPLGVEPTLVMCGRYRAQAFTMRRWPAGWRGVLARTFKRPPPSRPLAEWLRDVDAAPLTEPEEAHRKATLSGRVEGGLREGSTS